MLKRPKFLKFLIIAYLIYSIVSITQLIILGFDQPASNIAANIINFNSITYFKYFSLMFSSVLTIALFYNLLALRIHGWFLQITFSIYYIYLLIISLNNTQEMSSAEVFPVLPMYILFPWAIFNVYVLYYFFTPKIINLFFNRFKAQKLKNEELINLLHNANNLISEYQQQRAYVEINENPKQSVSGNKKTFRPVGNVKYLPTARVLIAEPKSIAELKQIQELNSMIEKNAHKIINMLKSILPGLHDQGVIELNVYKYYKNVSWNTEDVILDFKERALSICEDKRVLADKVFKYAKKVDELELLKNTCHLMDSWLNDTGNEVGNLIQLESL